MLVFMGHLVLHRSVTHYMHYTMYNYSDVLQVCILARYIYDLKVYF